LSDVWSQGFRINSAAVAERRAIERQNTAQVIREIKALVKRLLPFPDVPNEALMRTESWYSKNYQKYRTKITDFANQLDSDDPLTQVMQISGAVSNAWALEEGLSPPTGPNWSHYMVIRTALYDLIGCEPITIKGKIQSDTEARGRLISRLEDNEITEKRLIFCINELAGIEQRMKLYLTPYTKLIRPRYFPYLS